MAGEFSPELLLAAAKARRERGDWANALMGGFGKGLEFYNALMKAKYAGKLTPEQEADLKLAQDKFAYQKENDAANRAIDQQRVDAYKAYLGRGGSSGSTPTTIMDPDAENSAAPVNEVPVKPVPTTPVPAPDTPVSLLPGGSSPAVAGTSPVEHPAEEVGMWDRLFGTSTKTDTLPPPGRGYRGVTADPRGPYGPPGTPGGGLGRAGPRSEAAPDFSAAEGKLVRDKSTGQVFRVINGQLVPQ